MPQFREIIKGYYKRYARLMRDLRRFSPFLGDRQLLALLSLVNQADRALQDFRLESVDLVIPILNDAVGRLAAEIKIEPGPWSTIVEYRSAGGWRPILECQAGHAGIFAAKLRIMSYLDVTKRDQIQEGAIQPSELIRAGCGELAQLKFLIKTEPADYGQRSHIRIDGGPPIEGAKRQILDFITGFLKKHGHTPSRKEIGDGCGLPEADLERHLCVLTDSGVLSGAAIRRETLDPSLFENRPGFEVATLAFAGRQQVTETLLRWLTGWLSRPPADWEMLWKAGRAVAASGHLDVDQAVFEWSQRLGSAAAHELACGFLAGYWERADRIHLPAVEALLKEIDTNGQLNPKDLKLPDEAYRNSEFHTNWVICALNRAIANSTALTDHQRARLRDSLMSYLELLETAFPGETEAGRYLENLFLATLPPEEELRLRTLMDHIKTVEEAISKLGPPDMDCERGEPLRLPPTTSEASTVVFPRTLTYRRLSAFAEIILRDVGSRGVQVNFKKKTRER